MSIAAKLVLVSLFSLLLSGAASVAILARARSAQDRESRILGQLAESSDGGRRLQVEFKKQVQEWKDLLLRGLDPALMQKYTTQFHERSRAVEALGQQLGQGLSPAAQAIVGGFLAVHRTLDGEYELALATFQATGGRDFRAADARVKGKDRPPTDLLDQLVEQIIRDAGSARAALHEEQARESAIICWALGGCLLALVGVALIHARSIGRGLRDLLGGIRALAEADSRSTAPLDERRTDELGALGVQFNRLIARLGKLSAGTGSAADTLATAAQSLAGNSDKIRSVAQETSARALVVSDAAALAATNMKQMAAGVEEMAGAAGAIARDAAASSRISSDAVGIIRATRQNVDVLSVASTEIGEVLAVISQVSDRTRLLALNASIEAARAGAAGSGFAVVANEVKELATRTARSTDEIRERVGSIQASVAGALADIERIGAVVGEVSQLGAAIAAAVEEQSAAAAQIQESSRHVAGSIERIAESIAGVAGGAQETSRNVDASHTSALATAQLAARMRLLLSQQGMRAD